MGVADIIDAPGLAYLASPYSHVNPAVRHARFLEAEAAWAWLQQNRVFAISPVVMCHEVARTRNLPFTAEFWSPLNGRLFFACKRLIVLCTDGWRESAGVTQEMRWAEAVRMPTYIMTAVEDEYIVNNL